MALDQKRTGRAAPVPGGLAVGAAVSLGITLLASAFLAWLVDKEKLLWENVGYGIMILVFLASFLGALASHHRIKRQRLLVCLLSGILYFGILLSLTALFFGGQYHAVGVTGALVLAGSGAAGLLGLEKKRGSGTRKAKMRTR